MREYHKIHTIFKRDKDTNQLLIGQYSLPAFEYLQYNQWMWEEKIDGTNIRIMYEMGKIRIGGKTDNAQIPATLYEKIAMLISANQMLDAFGDAQVCLYGEGYGAKIQKGSCYIKDGVDFILFDVWINGWWISREGVTDIANMLGLKRVPIIGQSNIKDAISEVAKGFTSTFGNFFAEGLILRPLVDLYDRTGNRMITKIKHKDFIN